MHGCARAAARTGMYILQAQPKEAVHAKVGPIQHLSFEEMALLHVCYFKLIVACIGFMEATREKDTLNGSGKVPVPKNVCLENMHCVRCTHTTNTCLHCMNVCGVTAIGVRVRTAVVRFDLVGVV